MSGNSRFSVFAISVLDRLRKNRSSITKGESFIVAAIGRVYGPVVCNKGTTQFYVASRAQRRVASRRRGNVCRIISNGQCRDEKNEKSRNQPVSEEFRLTRSQRMTYWYVEVLLDIFTYDVLVCQGFTDHFYTGRPRYFLT